MSEPWLTLCVPTIGRTHLATTLASVRAQAGPADVELLVAGDTHGTTWTAALAAVPALCAAYDATYLPVDGGCHGWGGAQRTVAQQQARGAWLAVLQDDNALVPGALAALVAALATGPIEPLFGRVRCNQRGRWHTLPEAPPRLACGYVDGDCVIYPNDPPRLPPWPNDPACYTNDWEFIAALVAAWDGRYRWWDYVWITGSVHTTGGLG